MRVRGWCLTVWGVLCGAMFLVIFVSKARTGDLYAYVLMAMVLTASLLSVKEGRRRLSTPRAVRERSASVVS